MWNEPALVEPQRQAGIVVVQQVVHVLVADAVQRVGARVAVDRHVDAPGLSKDVSGQILHALALEMEQVGGEREAVLEDVDVGGARREHRQAGDQMRHSRAQLLELGADGARAALPGVAPQPEVGSLDLEPAVLVTRQIPRLQACRTSQHAWHRGQQHRRKQGLGSTPIAESEHALTKGLQVASEQWRQHIAPADLLGPPSPL
jgi:hypothetical protein